MRSGPVSWPPVSGRSWRLASGHRRSCVMRAIAWGRWMASSLSGQGGEVLSIDWRRPHCRAISFAVASLTERKSCLGCRWIQAGLAIMLMSLLVVRTPAKCAEAPEGVWLIDSNSALQIFDCDGLLCGRVAWLRNIRDRAGQIQRDKYNPDHGLRQRFVSGLTVIWGLHPTGSGNWQDGWFYNPDDGNTYRAAAELRSNDTLVARIYLGMPLFGSTKILRRVSRLSAEGWCVNGP